jgi:hypothetical protein
MSFWLFHTSAKKYRVHDALEDLDELTWDVWRDSKKFGPISVGDRACLFESGSNGGIYGIVEVTEGADDRSMPLAEYEYVTDINKFKPTSYRVIVRPLTQLSLKLSRDWIEKDPVLSGLPVFRNPVQVIFSLDERLWNAVLSKFSGELSNRSSPADRLPIPTDDHRQFVSRLSPVRPGQATFRQMLLAAYQGRCAITGCDVKTALEASHLVNYVGPRSDRIDNGLLLRVDLHRLFDAHLLSIDPDSWRVRISPAISGSLYGKWEGQSVRVPERDDQKPSKEKLKEHLLKTIGE